MEKSKFKNRIDQFISSFASFRLSCLYNRYHHTSFVLVQLKVMKFSKFYHLKRSLVLFLFNLDIAPRHLLRT